MIADQYVGAANFFKGSSGRRSVKPKSLMVAKNIEEIEAATVSLKLS